MQATAADYYADWSADRWPSWSSTTRRLARSRCR
jgi:hypothetical protein